MPTIVHVGIIVAALVCGACTNGTFQLGTPPSVVGPGKPLQTLSGKGSGLSRDFSLEPGATIFHFRTRNVEQFFSAALLDAASGQRVTSIGDTNDQVVINQFWAIEATGPYVFQVQAEGEWSVEVEQPRPPAAPKLAFLAGRRNDVAGPFSAKDGKHRFTFEHKGPHLFGATLYNAAGKWVALLASYNGPGVFFGTATLSAETFYWIAATGSGDWAVAIEQQ